MAAFEAIVSGRVQGVGFRWFVLEQAQGQGVRGQVRNLSGGAVEVLAEGERPALDALLDALGQGPSHALVMELKVNWLDEDRRFTKFDVAH